MKPEMCREARLLLCWSVEDLALAAKRATQTVRNVERGRHRPYAGTSAFLRSAFETAGIEFVVAGGEVVVRMRQMREGEG